MRIGLVGLRTKIQGTQAQSTHDQAGTAKMRELIAAILLQGAWPPTPDAIAATVPVPGEDGRLTQPVIGGSKTAVGRSTAEPPPSTAMA